MINELKLGLFTIALAGASLVPLYAMEDSLDPDRISKLSDEIKQNILGRLDSKSLTCVKEVNKSWNGQANDEKLQNIFEDDYEKAANQAGIVIKYNEGDSWRETFLNRDNKEWILNKFKESMEKFSNIRGVATHFLQPQNIINLFKMEQDPNGVINKIKNSLGQIKPGNASRRTLVGELEFHTSFGGALFTDLLEINNPHAHQHLSGIKRVENIENLSGEEILSFFAVNQIPVLSDPTDDAFPIKFIVADLNHEAVREAIISSSFMTIARQFIREYERPIKCEDDSWDSDESEEEEIDWLTYNARG